MTIARHAHPDLLDNGCAYLKATASRILLVPNYVKNASYASVEASKLAEAAITAADFGAITSVGDNRRCTFNGKAGSTATATITGADLAFAFVSSDNRVLYVTDESTDMPVTAGNTINFPALSYTSNYPT
jgi:hypothetical protein